MKHVEFFTESKSKWLSIYAIAILLILFGLPFNTQLSKLFIFSGVFIWLINPAKQIRFFNVLSIKSVLVICSSYVVLFIGLIYTENLSYGLHLVEGKIFLVILPILIIFSKLSSEHIKFILTGFVVSVLCASLYSLYEAYQLYRTFGDASVFFNIELTKHLKLHPNYFALYVSISIFHLISIIKDHVKYVKIIILSVIAFLVVMNFLLLSRIVLLAFLISLTLVFLYFFKNKYRYVYVASILFLLIVLFTVAYTSFPSFQLRINDAFSFSNYSREPVWTSSSGIHFKCWSCAVESLKGWNFILGHGTGDERNVLLKCYARNGWDEMIKQNLNSHNEYLSSTMRCGILGLFTLLLVLLQSLYFSIRHNDYVLFAFVILFFFSFMTGSLGLEQGVIFFGTMNALLIKRCIKLESLKI